MQSTLTALPTQSDLQTSPRSSCEILQSTASTLHELLREDSNHYVYAYGIEPEPLSTTLNPTRTALRIETPSKLTRFAIRIDKEKSELVFAVLFLQRKRSGTASVILTHLKELARQLNLRFIRAEDSTSYEIERFLEKHGFTRTEGVYQRSGLFFGDWLLTVSS